MDRKNASTAQVSALTKFMQEHGDIVSRSGPNLLENRLESESLWRELTDNLNAIPGGAVKSTEKWKQTWRDVKSSLKKKNHQQSCDTSVGHSSDSLQGAESSFDNNSKDDYIPAKRRHVSFDEEIIKIERDKLELDREYKAQKIEVMARIASALEELSRRRHEEL